MLPTFLSLGQPSLSLHSPSFLFPLFLSLPIQIWRSRGHGAAASGAHYLREAPRSGPAAELARPRGRLSWRSSRARGSGLGQSSRAAADVARWWRGYGDVAPRDATQRRRSRRWHRAAAHWGPRGGRHGLRPPASHLQTLPHQVDTRASLVWRSVSAPALRSSTIHRNIISQQSSKGSKPATGQHAAIFG